MLVEMAIGDAYGAAFEFIRRPYPGLVHDLATHQRHPELPNGAGRYTDDTQMALALAEHLLEGAPFDPTALADRFLTTFKRDPRTGYSKGFHAALTESLTGEGLLARLGGGSTRSGAAMRAGPIGFVRDLAQVLDLAERQASVTHDSPQGRLSASAVAATTHYFAFGLGSRRDLGAFLEATVPGHPWAADHVEWVTVEGLDCAHAAVTALRHGATLSGVLKHAVDLGGDTDTVAAIALGAAALGAEIPNDLASSLYDGLEDGAFGRTYLAAVDTRLMSRLAKGGL